MAEYDACIAGLRAAQKLSIKRLRVVGDSLLVICQTRGEWRTRDDKVVPYKEYLQDIIAEFEEVTFSYLPRLV